MKEKNKQTDCNGQSSQTNCGNQTEEKKNSSVRNKKTTKATDTLSDAKESYESR